MHLRHGLPYTVTKNIPTINLLGPNIMDSGLQWHLRSNCLDSANFLNQKSDEIQLASTPNSWNIQSHHLKFSTLKMIGSPKSWSILSTKSWEVSSNFLDMSINICQQSPNNLVLYSHLQPVGTNYHGFRTLVAPKTKLFGLC